MHSNVKIPIFGFVLYLFLGCYIAFAETAAESEKLATTINYLLSFVENSDCTFIRNEKAIFTLRFGNLYYDICDLTVNALILQLI